MSGASKRTKKTRKPASEALLPKTGRDSTLRARYPEGTRDPVVAGKKYSLKELQELGDRLFR